MVLINPKHASVCFLTNKERAKCTQQYCYSAAIQPMHLSQMFPVAPTMSFISIFPFRSGMQRRVTYCTQCPYLQIHVQCGATAQVFLVFSYLTVLRRTGQLLNDPWFSLRPFQAERTLGVAGLCFFFISVTCRFTAAIQSGEMIGISECGQPGYQRQD